MNDPTRSISTVADLRREVAGWRSAGERIALVPTMGALHAGHVALMHAARQCAQRVVLSIFVNPTQFGPSEDLSRYPRTLADDLEKASGAKIDVVFVPEPAEMYPEGFSTTISIKGPAEGLETGFRPTHFAGVATVVAKLLNQVQPDVALFGEKDYQQLQVINRLVKDLDLPVEIVGVPTVREADGLAMSSRNRYLGSEERARAVALYQAITSAADSISAGDDIPATVAEARAQVERAGFVVDYLEARHSATLTPVASKDEPIRILVAARIGNTRLIDNVPVGR